MSELKKLKDFGVTRIQVKDGIATAVIPNQAYSLSYYEIKAIPPLLAPSVPDREYGIDELDEQEQYYSPAANDWIIDDDIEGSIEGGYDTRTVLILKQPAGNGKQVCSAIKDLIQVFSDEQPEPTPVPLQKWISVERLPEHHNDVLTYCNGYYEVAHLYKRGESTFVDKAEESSISVQFWMPLPEKPKD